jgi:hypothetical protein
MLCFPCLVGDLCGRAGCLGDRYDYRDDGQYLLAKDGRECLRRHNSCLECGEFTGVVAAMCICAIPIGLCMLCEACLGRAELAHGCVHLAKELKEGVRDGFFSATALPVPPSQQATMGQCPHPSPSAPPGCLTGMSKDGVNPVCNKQDELRTNQQDVLQCQPNLRDERHRKK